MDRTGIEPAATGMTSRIARIMSVLAALLLCVVPGAAQVGPDGNAHPQTKQVSEGEASNPFGDPQAGEAMSIASKREFAAGVDLDPLRGLAVFHSGRVKILDTLARETVRDLAGRKDYVDFLHEPGDGGREQIVKVHYDPLFTLLDLIIDPAYYTDKPLMHVEFLPLRELFLDKVFPADTEAHERWKKLGRLRPRDIGEFGGVVSAELPMEAPYLNAMSRVRGSASLFLNSWRNLLMVAPDAEHAEWWHLGSYIAENPGSPIAAAAEDLGAAWRAGDAAKVNEAARVLAAELPKVNPEMYPASRAGVELAYNKVKAFEWGSWLYVLSLITLLLAFGTGRRWLKAGGVSLLLLAAGMHAFGFITRCIIAERFAIQNQFESMTGLSLFAVVVGIGLMLGRRQLLFGAAAAGVGFMVLLAATQTAIPGGTIEREAAILNTSVLLKYHVTTVLVSYGLISLGFIMSLFYLGVHYAARARAAGNQAAVAVPGGGSLMVDVSAGALGIDDEVSRQGAGAAGRVLHDLDKSTMIVLQLAFWTLGVGILLGAWWADHSWGRWWAFDPKELWALVTWIVYLVVIHVRFTSVRNKGLITAWLSVLGFIVMLWTYFGVNLLLPGLHAYA